VRPGGCAAFAVVEAGEERVAIVAEVDRRDQPRTSDNDLAPVLASIRLAIASAHQVAPCSVALVEAGTIPKTTSGKLQRFLCRDALINGGLAPLASWTDGAAIEAVAS
jgi:myxalamid-type polyketide synthase MxaE and MxaD